MAMLDLYSNKRHCQTTLLTSKRDLILQRVRQVLNANSVVWKKNLLLTMKRWIFIFGRTVHFSLNVPTAIKLSRSRLLTRICYRSVTSTLCSSSAFVVKKVCMLTTINSTSRISSAWFLSPRKLPTDVDYATKISLRLGKKVGNIIC